MMWLVAGCGARSALPDVAPSAAQGEAVISGSSTTASAGTAEAPGSQTQESAPQASAEGGASAGAAALRPTPQPTGGFGPEHNKNVRVTIADQCVRPAEIVTAEIYGPRNAGLTMVVGFSDNDSHGIIGAAKTDPFGRFTWRFPVPLDAPPGWALALVNATGRDWNEFTGEGGTEGGGTGSAPFQVAGPNGCT
jgi:hypothetical protein